MKVYSLIFLIAFSSCAKLQPKKKVIIEQKVLKKTVQFDRYHEIRPGEVIRVHLPLVKNPDANILYCRTKPIMYHSFGEYNEAYIAETYFSKMDAFNCYYADEYKKKKQYLIKVSVVNKNFPSEKLNVDKKRVKLSKKDLSRVWAEQKVLNKIYKNSSLTPYFNESFLLPLNSKITSIYGSRRIFNGNKKTQHLGTDFRAPVGEPIKSTNAGKVVLARDLFYTGNTVIVDHGLGIFTVYGHLSKLETTEGERVPRMGLLGLAGATGRVTGPHLHWGVKIHGDWIEGLSLVNATK